MVRLFDCDVGVGGTGFDYPTPADPQELLAMMDHHGIEAAIVYDRGAHESGVFDRFDFILDFCRHSDRLSPSIPILPPACGEQPGPGELIDLILAEGVKAVRACPTMHNFHFDPFSMGPLLEGLEAHRIPVLHTSQAVQDHPWMHEPPWRAIREVAGEFPDLPIVVLYSGMLQGRRLLPLLAGRPNVLADLTCAAFQYIEYVVERFGAERLVFASHLPTEDPALYAPALRYAGIRDDQRQLIAAGNVRRLLEGIR